MLVIITVGLLVHHTTHTHIVKVNLFVCGVLCSHLLPLIFIKPRNVKFCSVLLHVSLLSL